MEQSGSEAWPSFMDSRGVKMSSPPPTTHMHNREPPCPLELFFEWFWVLSILHLFIHLPILHLKRFNPEEHGGSLS